MIRIVLRLLVVLAFANHLHAKEEIDYAQVLRTIAKEIALLKEAFPQLEKFSPETDLDLEKLTISYDYKTHRAEKSGGWTAGVPSPDDNGIWFYIDFHDPRSTRQIHTQPFTVASVEKAMLGELALSFLILEGRKNKSVESEIWKILNRNGVKPTEKQR